jgi:hypothetical protein
MKHNVEFQKVFVALGIGITDWLNMFLDLNLDTSVASGHLILYIYQILLS